MGELARPHREGDPRRPGRGRDRPGGGCRAAPLRGRGGHDARERDVRDRTGVDAPRAGPAGDRATARRGRSAGRVAGVRRAARRRASPGSSAARSRGRRSARSAPGDRRSTNGSRQRTSASGSGLWKYGIDWRRVFATPCGRIDDAVRRRDPAIVRHAHQRVAEVDDVGAVDRGHVDPAAVARLRLQPAGRGLRAQDREEAVVRVHARAQLARLGRARRARDSRSPAATRGGCRTSPRRRPAASPAASAKMRAQVRRELAERGEVPLVRRAQAGGLGGPGIARPPGAVVQHLLEVARRALAAARGERLGRERASTSRRPARRRSARRGAWPRRAGRRTRARARRARRSTSSGTPCPVTQKNPISSQAARTASTTALAPGSPARTGARSMTGISSCSDTVLRSRAEGLHSPATATLRTIARTTAGRRTDGSRRPHRAAPDRPRPRAGDPRIGARGGGREGSPRRWRCATARAT